MQVNKVHFNFGIILVSIAALLWGTSFVVVRWGLEQNIDPIIFVALRFVLATLIFLPIAAVKVSNLKALLFNKNILLLGTFNATAFAFQFVGQRYTSAGKASLFVNFYVLIVPLLAPFFLEEKLSFNVIISAVLGFFGAFLVSTNLDLTQISFDKGTIKGDLISLSSGMSWVFYIILSKRYLERNKGKSGIAIFFGTIVWTTIILLIAVPVNIFIKRMSISFIDQFSWKSIVAIVYLAVICTALAFAIYMEGLKHAEAGESSIFMLLEVVVAFILEWIIFGTIPELWSSIGVILIIIAVLMLSFRHDQKTEKSEMQMS